MTQVTDCATGLVFSAVPAKWKKLSPKTLTYNVGRFGLSYNEFYELMDRVFYRQKKLIESKKFKLKNITFAVCFDNFKKMNTLYKWILMNKHNIHNLQKYGIFIYLITPNNLNKKLFNELHWEFDELIFKPEEKQELMVYSRNYNEFDINGNVKDVSKYFRYSE
ncbi:Hypothetical protein PACV_461 [Pacmanvirus A23]|uniref:Hypothetical protein n=1 Tax=Pacmanvirus A23 TaxID=1932881 RepID=UPI000A0950BF|nr:Hypothetical protein B9W72_gp462 [Pacmanvirus A23]SIP86173.1 Hypothetical protein PACV_461 [Pacmanvirus A23]